jgi:hypothetical protein
MIGPLPERTGLLFYRFAPLPISVALLLLFRSEILLTVRDCGARVNGKLRATRVKWARKEKAMKLATIVNKAVSLSEAIFQYWDRELRKRYPHYPLVYPGEEENDGPPPPQQKKLRELLASLPEEMLYKLALIKDVGTGLAKANDLQRGYETLREVWTNPAQLIEMLLERPLYYDLPDGLERLKNQGIDPEKMDFTRARAEK